MSGELKLTIYIESNSQTLQSADMDTIGHPICTGTNASDWGSESLGKEGSFIPQDHRILLDAAGRAAEKLGITLGIIDIAKYGYFQKRKLKKVIPSIEMGEKVITGLPTSDEIVDVVQPLMAL